MAQNAPELTLEHSNFKNFSGGACPQTPLDWLGFTDSIPTISCQPPHPKTSSYATVGAYDLVCSNSFLEKFITWINLDLGLEVCLYDGLMAYAKTCYSFSFQRIYLVISTILLS